MKATTIELFLLLAVAVLGVAVADPRFVSCGSVVKLRHISSEKYYLKSSPNKLRSGQQVVTLDTVRGDSGANMLWQVSIYHSSSSFQHHTIPHLFTIALLHKIREAHNTTSCKTGEAVKCGEIIRLTHLATRKNLHSHALPAPLSRYNNEVSGYGNDGDTGDNWQVECLQHKQKSAAQNMWESTQLVRFMHQDTNRWLSSSPKSKFSQTNCPNCPVHGELEVSGINRNSDVAGRSSIFQADDGIYLLRQ